MHYLRCWRINPFWPSFLPVALGILRFRTSRERITFQILRPGSFLLNLDEGDWIFFKPHSRPHRRTVTEFGWSFLHNFFFLPPLPQIILIDAYISDLARATITQSRAPTL